MALPAALLPVIGWITRYKYILLLLAVGVVFGSGFYYGRQNALNGAARDRLSSALSDLDKEKEAKRDAVRRAERASKDLETLRNETQKLLDEIGSGNTPIGDGDSLRVLRQLAERSQRR